MKQNPTPESTETNVSVAEEDEARLMTDGAGHGDPEHAERVASPFEEILECDYCGSRWSSLSDLSRVTCPECECEAPRNVVAEERSVHGKWTFDGAETIEEMAGMLEAKADALRELAGVGWELRDPVVDDWAWLRRERLELETQGDNSG